MRREFQFKASIIIPVLNEEKFIEECIESVVSNTDDIEKMEIIIVDGGSEDNTVEIVKKISSKFKNLILLHNPKKNYSYFFKPCYQRVFWRIYS